MCAYVGDDGDVVVWGAVNFFSPSVILCQTHSHLCKTDGKRHLGWGMGLKTWFLGHWAQAGVWCPCARDFWRGSIASIRRHYEKCPEMTSGGLRQDINQLGSQKPLAHPSHVLTRCWQRSREIHFKNNSDKNHKAFHHGCGPLPASH